MRNFAAASLAFAILLLATPLAAAAPPGAERADQDVIVSYAVASTYGTIDYAFATVDTTVGAGFSTLAYTIAYAECLPQAVQHHTCA